MLELKHISKTYTVGNIKTEALDDISVAFREKEFVAILGTSGSGKTTFLNIVGGLDRYDSGELIIKGKQTKDFKEKDWDAYRNNSVGFVFQSYNLIPHLSIVSNVEMSMTLSGVPASEKRQRAIAVLEEVGLKEHLHKKPTQLSGGQMQRVAIARALVNDPEILLCDEPTGALDTTTSRQIMDLIKSVSKDRLVIVVTHNPMIAEQYADRVVEFSDGHIISDSNPYEVVDEKQTFSLKKTSMNYFTALSLSFKNIWTKKGRTLLTSLASSIGIIGIAIVLSLSTGFQLQIDDFQQDAMAEFPVMISQSAMETDEESLQEMMNEFMPGEDTTEKPNEIVLYDAEDAQIIHTNVLTDEYMEYVENINPEYISSIGYVRIPSMNMLRKTDDGVIPASMTIGGSMGMDGNISSMRNMGTASFPVQKKEEESSYLESKYDLLHGEYPKEDTDVVLVLDEKNRADIGMLEKLGFDTTGVDTLSYEDIVGTELVLVQNDDFYMQTQYGTYLPREDYDALYDNANNITIKISAVVRQKDGVGIGMLANGIAYSDALAERLLENSVESEIVKAQEAVNFNIFTTEEFAQGEKENMLMYLGGEAQPMMIMVYPKNFEAKDEITAYLDAYNVGKDKEDAILYTDLASSISSMTGGIMDGITIVLIAFAAISLVVSMIMIGIITYTSVLERTKEIGILKALGARKRDITRVFDAETTIIGVFSGLLGILIAWLLTFPINNLLFNLTSLSGVAVLRLDHALLLVLISTVLTIIGGHIPARMASKKDAVEALRSE